MIGATFHVHDPIRLDYCFKEAFASAKEACDHIVVVDAGSNDGTVEWLEEQDQSDLTVVHTKWEPSRLGVWLADLVNLGISHLPESCTHHFQFDADEVLHEADIPLLSKYKKKQWPIIVQRLNFARNAWQLVRPGRWCGHRIVRFAPKNCPSHGDGEGLDASGYGQPLESPIRLFHYGQMRKIDAWCEKQKLMEEAYFNTHNPLIDAIEKGGAKVLDDFYIEDRTIPVPVGTTHPKYMTNWLKERGWL